MSICVRPPSTSHSRTSPREAVHSSCRNPYSCTTTCSHRWSAACPDQTLRIYSGRNYSHTLSTVVELWDILNTTGEGCVYMEGMPWTGEEVDNYLERYRHTRPKVSVVTRDTIRSICSISMRRSHASVSGLCWRQ